MAKRQATQPAHSGDAAPVAPSVLWKAFDVLGAFSESRRVLTLAQIVQRSGLPKSTAHRVLTMLLEVGAVEQHGGGYRMGLRMFTLGTLPPEVALRDAAQVHLEALHRLTGQTLHLATLRDGDVVYLEKLRSRNGLSSPAVVGGRLPAHCTAVGKAQLAFSGEQIVADVLSGPLPRRTARSASSADEIRRQLFSIRHTGFAVDRQEAVEGLACVAVPVLVQDRAVAAVSVGFPASEGSGQVLVNLLRQTSAAISRALLGSPVVDVVASAG
ncbi:IclR family transcriptional regulator [Streptomyces vastus]|uniref:IclR family transcriptional regulator n=1 Tax=Streptomyces vastus TaxID=285451 RepID=A0ABP6DP80_9ACTN